MGIQREFNGSLIVRASYEYKNPIGCLSNDSESFTLSVDHLVSMSIRKSAGPFRFNLSKSGVDISVGVKGLRLGTGPRGNYVHMRRNGIYCRATLSSEKMHHLLGNSMKKSRCTDSQAKS